MDIAMIKQIRSASGMQEKRAFPETGRTDNNNFEKWLQRSQTSAVERGSERFERSGSNNETITRQSTKSKEQAKKNFAEKELTEKDLKKLTKALDLFSDESIDEIDLTTLLKLLDDDQLTKLLEMLGEDFAEMVVQFNEMLELFRENEITVEKPKIENPENPENLEKLLKKMSDKLEAAIVSVEKSEKDSLLNDFLKSLTEEINKVQEQLASESMDQEKPHMLLSNDSLNNPDLKDSVERKESSTDSSLRIQEIKDAKIPKDVNNEPEMQSGKEDDNSKGKDESLNMAENITVKSDVKVDAEAMMPFQEIEALLEKNLQLVDEVKMEKLEIQQRVMEDLVTKISMLHEKGESRIQMQLIPEHLGKLTIHLTSQDGNMTARIFAETSYARDMIDNNFGQLRDALSGKGVNNIQLEVFVGKDPEGYEKRREFEKQMHQGKRKRQINEVEKPDSAAVAGIPSAMGSLNPYLEVEGFDRIG